MKRQSHLSATLLCAASALAISSAAFAQQANQPPPPANQPAPPIQQAEEFETIEITGTRINSVGFQSPTPVTAVTLSDIEVLSPVSISDGLRQLPSLFGSNGAAAAGAQPSSASSNISQFSGAFLNLRSLGAVRTLIMQDGDRIAPTRADGQVDTNLMPQMLTARVDIVTGGASAVYGSDAVAGVINYITDTNFEGVKFQLKGGGTQYYDNTTYGAGVAMGRSFLSGRLHVIGSAEFTRNYGVLSQCARPLGCMMYSAYGAAGPGGNGQPNPGQNAANPWADGGIPYAGNTRVSYYGNVTTGPAGLLNMKFTDPSGVSAASPLGATPSALSPYNTGTAAVTGSTCYSCDAGHYNPKDQYLVPPSSTYHGFFRAQYDISENLNIWARATYGSNAMRQVGVVQFNSGNMTIFSGNAFLPAAAQTILTNTNTASFRMSKIWQTIPNVQTWLGTSSAIFAAGLRGTFADSWVWSASASYGQSRNAVRGRELETAKYYAALDAVRAPAGNSAGIPAGEIVCRVALTNPGKMPGCAPLDPFGPTAALDVTPAGLDYVQGNYKYGQYTHMTDARLNLSGELFELPAGPLAVSTGYEWRRLGLTVKSDNVTPDLTGIRGTSTDLQFLYNNILTSGGSYDVHEMYAEAGIPVLADLPLVQSLDVNVAGRFTRYSISGDTTTWKVGATWEIDDSIRLRGTISRDLRAPTLNDFFAPATFRNSAFTDTLTNTSGIVTQVTGGNLLLKPEKAITRTYGVVFSPEFISGFTMSVDVYNISISDMIAAPFGAGAIEEGCTLSGGTDPFFCSAVTRPFPYTNTTNANFPTRIFVGNGNISKQVVAGTDWEAAYTTPFADGNLSLHLLATYQQKDVTQTTPTAAPINSAVVNRPMLTGNLSISYRTQDDWNFTVLERYVGSYKRGSANPATPTYFSKPTVPAFLYTNLSVSKSFKDANTGWNYQLGFNVTNLFDKEPPLLPGTLAGFGYPTQPLYFDVIGRSFALSFRGNF